MEQMATSSSSDGDRMAKLSNRQHGAPPAAAQGLPSQPPLNCPRCDSTNTKFCYYNNYSQAQPRHFCKSCRRYWTQGGTLRNVPVGGGCRKNKRVRPRSLMSMGGLDHVPTTAFPDATSSMLGRLSSIPSFGNGCDNTSSQLLNIAFARFQESLRPRQQAAQAAEGAPFSDMSLPALVHKPCSLSSCGALMVDGFDHNNFGFQALAAEPGYHRSSYEMPNPALYAQTHSLMGTSATATLDSLEDELSSFSNLQFHLNPMSSDVVAQEDKPFTLPACSAAQRLLPRPPSMEHGGSHLSYAGTPLGSASSDLHRENAEDDKAIKEEIKPIVDMTGESRLSLMIPADSNWQQQQQHQHQHQHQHHQQQEPSSMNDILFNEPHHAMMWPPNTGRWQDMHTTSVL